MNKIYLIFIALILALLIWVVANPMLSNNQTSNKVLGPYPNVKGGEFSLNSANGTVSLSDFKGKVTLLYFGYTWCPDVCPTNLSLLANAFTQLSESELSKIQGAFISVDPERDTLEKLEEYSQYFHPKIIGLTASAAEVSAIAKKYSVSYRLVKLEKSATDYVVDHSSVTYIVDQDGQLVEILPHATGSEKIVERIRYYLNK